MSSIHLEPQDLPDVAPHNHGRTMAAWVTNASIAVGALLMSIGFAISFAPLLWVGGAIAIIGSIAGGVLRALGHGQSLG
ncbi:HGxxPAAW family protein [Demequina aurantiaca]|uniref:HGxxPAAW family protein n=1 Tax=Demequina aurantiaca TaxID=676200 RepID=UPI000784B1DB|nr:HGxxPAAW family protein [Demequina aurantiaca]